MKHTGTRYSKAKGQAQNDLITRLQKKCIYDISAICSERKRSSKKRRLFGGISHVFLFASVLTLFLSLILKLIHAKDDKVYSVISVISAAASLIFGTIQEIETEKERAFSNEIKLLEDVIDSSENI